MNFSKHITITVNKEYFERATEALFNVPECSDVAKHFSLIQIGETPEEAVKREIWRREEYPEHASFITSQTLCMEAYAKELWYQSHNYFDDKKYSKAHSTLLQAIRIYEYLIRENTSPEYYSELQHSYNSFRVRLNYVETVMSTANEATDQPMTFGEVLQLMSNGKRYRRLDWAENAYIVRRHVTGGTTELLLKDTRGYKYGWVPKNEDMFAHDWVEYEGDNELREISKHEAERLLDEGCIIYLKTNDDPIDLAVNMVRITKWRFPHNHSPVLDGTTPQDYGYKKCLDYYKDTFGLLKMYTFDKRDKSEIIGQPMQQIN